MTPDLLKRLQGCVLGFAVGDALGAPVAFESPAAIRSRHGHLSEMKGGGRMGLPPGSTTAATSLFRAVAESLVARASLDPEDLCRRLRGVAVARPPGLAPGLAERLLALGTGVTSGGRDEDNACLILALPLAAAYRDRPDEMLRAVAALLGLTHPHPRCRAGAAVVARLAGRAMTGAWGGLRDELPALARSLDPEGARRVAEAPGRREQDLRSTSHVLDTVEVLLWSLARSRSFGEALVRSLNLGGDATVTCGLAGALAGSRWGKDAIPRKWLGPLQEAGDLAELGRRLGEAAA